MDTERIIKLADSIEDHKDWLAFMEFGRGAILCRDDHSLMVELLFREAMRKHSDQELVLSHLQDSMIELRLGFSLGSPAEE